MSAPYKWRQNAGTVSAVLTYHHLMSDLRRLREKVLLKFKGRKKNNKASLGAGLPILTLTAGQEVNQTQITHPPPPTSQTAPNSTCSIVSFTR